MLSPNSADPLLYEATLTLEQSRRLKLELIDDAGHGHDRRGAELGRDERFVKVPAAG